MAARFEISKDKAGKFRFHLTTANGETIPASQGYDANAGGAPSNSGSHKHDENYRLRALARHA